MKNKNGWGLAEMLILSSIIIIALIVATVLIVKFLGEFNI